MRLRTIFGAVISLGLLAFALSFLFKIADRYKYEDIVAHLHELPWWQIGIALGLTVISYLLLTCYDWLALVYLKRKLPYRRIALASFVGYTFSHNLGFALVTGSSVRYRLYTLWGLSPSQIAQLVLFCSVTFFLGLFAMGGLALLYAPPTLPAELLAEKQWMADLGDALFVVLAWSGIACAIAYIAIPLFWRKPLVVRGVEIRFPGFGMSLAQLFIAGIDWMLAAGVLYALLPPDTRPDFLHVLTIFMAGNILGVMLHVPGGLGIFEAVVTALLSPVVPTEQLLGALIAYRVTYYVLPFITALLLFGGHEIWHAIGKASAGLQPASRSLMASTLALAVFAGGAIVMFSSATPTHAPRLEWLTQYVPAALIALSHFFAALFAFLLVLLARHLSRHSDNGFRAARLLLPVLAVLSVLKGLQIEIAIYLLIVWLALLPSGGYFTRKRSLLRAPFGNAWLVAIGTVVIATIWLTYFSWRVLPTDLSPLLQTELLSEQSRSLRALFAVPIGLAALALLRVLRPARTASVTATPERIQSLVAASPQPLSQLAKLGDKRFLISPDGKALLMYMPQGRSLVALGDCMGDPAAHEELLWQFRELCDQRNQWPVIYQARAENLSAYFDLGLIPHKLGEEAVLDLQQLDVHSLPETLRQAHDALAAAGLQLNVVSGAEAAAFLPQMKQVSDSWLRSRQTEERGFALGNFDANYLMQIPQALIYRGDQLVAFASLLVGAGKQAFAVDLLRHTGELGSGWLEYLYLELIRWGQAQGYREFHLGLVPSREGSDHPLTALWQRIGRTLFLHSRALEQDSDLRSFKQQFAPRWEDRYLLSPANVKLPLVLHDIGDLIDQRVGV